MITFVPTSKEGNYKSILEKQDTNGCVVYAIANSFDISYEEAFKFCERIYGRIIKKGVRTYVFHNQNEMISNHRISYYGKRMREIDNTHHSCGKKRKMSVQTFIKNYPKGIFIISVRGHAFTIKDGVVHGIAQDAKKTRTRVTKCWEVYDSSSDNETLKRKKICQSPPNSSFGSSYKKGDYIFLDRHIVRKGNKWLSNKTLVFNDHGISYQSKKELIAPNLEVMEQLIKEEYMIM